MRVVFAGTPEFAALALAALTQAGHNIVLVLTQPDRPAGRGMRVVPSPVKALALRHSLPLQQPESLKTPAAQEQIRACAADVMVVAAYGLILPAAILALPRLGCLNIHASLLPRWRGAAPIQRALLAGDPSTGISIMQMDAGLDTGPVLARYPLAIAPSDTAQSLHDRLAQLGACAITEVLPRLAELKPQPQCDAAATYAAKIDKAEAQLDWRLSAPLLERQVRAFNPYPVAHTRHRDAPLRIWRARVDPICKGAPGVVTEISERGVLVGCGEGGLLLEELQKQGGKRLPSADFLRGYAIEPGERLGA
jgi:methionyl-tRNA formyltransferase